MANGMLGTIQQSIPDRSVIYKTIGLQWSSVFLGIAWGWAAREFPWYVPTFWALPASLALAMLAIGLLKPRRTLDQRLDARLLLLLAALILYDVLVMLFDPFINAGDESSGFLAIAVIVLPLVCLRPLVRRRAWLASWSVVIFQATAVASLVYNFPAVGSGVGYFVIWIV